MNNEKLEVLEMEKNPNVVFNSNDVSGSEMADDFFDDDLVNLDFSGLDTNGQVNVQQDNNDLYAVEPVETVEEAPVQDVQEIIPETTEQLTVDNKVINDVPADKKEELDNSYVLSNFDVLFDSLYNDVVGANNLITDLIEKKSSLSKNEQLLEDFKEKFEKEKEDFRNFVEVQKKAIESEKSQAASYIESKRARLHTEEQKFNEDSEAKKNEISLLEQSLKLERDKFESEKASFEEKKRIELEQIAAEREKLTRDTEEFNVEKKLTTENLENTKKSLQNEQEQFAKYKELEQKKLDLEEKNLQASCARFKDLVSQFNSGFDQLPNENK